MLELLLRNLNSINAIKDKYCKIFNKKSINTILDLLFHIPYSCLERKLVTNLQMCQDKDNVILPVLILSYRTTSRAVIITAESNNTEFKILFFNVHNRHFFNYISSKFKVGEKYYIVGKIEYHNTWQFSHPEAYKIEDKCNIPSIEPIYHLFTGINNKQMINYISQALRYLPESIPEWIADHIIHKRNWCSWSESIRNCHTIKNSDDLNPHNKFRRRLAFDELLARQLALTIMHNSDTANNRELQFTGKLKNKIIKLLPFELTNGQKLVLADITKDQKNNKTITRLLQGDVGCGKTIIALLSCLNAIEANAQAVIIVPTSILANQHYQVITSYLALEDINIALLTSKTKKKQRETIIKDTKAGHINLLIGTHALIEDDIIFHDLASVVIDEQHKFGVEQRIKLCKKGNLANILLMTATPIPRTLSMINYGNIDISYIKEKPNNRKTINTTIMNTERISEIVDKLNDILLKKEKIYWICPMVERSEKIDLIAVEERYEFLKKYFGEQVGVLHGKMHKNDKDKTMLDFRDNNINILVATTVVEVGVDVKQASVIIIEQAERFGLSQLHQLRGRVGRSNIQSSCILLYKKPISSISYQRLQAMKQSNDGFYLSKVDMEIRGAGNVFGKEQSGFNDFKFFIPELHDDMIKDANDNANLILNNAQQPKIKKKAECLLKIFKYPEHWEYINH